VLDALVEGNREYEERFGHVYLVRADGRSAEELLAVLRERLGNDPATSGGCCAASWPRSTGSGCPGCSRTAEMDCTR